MKDFKIISELENIKQNDVKDEAKEKHLEEVLQYQKTEATIFLEKPAESKIYNSSPSAEAKGKLNPIKPVSISTAILGECKAGAPIEILRSAF